MHKRSRDLLIVALIAVAGMAAALSGANNLALGLLFGLPLTLALPGYALIAAGAPGGTLGPAERLTFSVGGSIALSVLGGFALNGTAWGLHAASWALLLGGLTLAACAVAFIQRRAITPDQATNRRVHLRPQDAGLFGLAALIAAGAFALAISGAAQPPANGFTQLWMLPAGESVRLGVQNMEAKAMRYAIELTVEERVIRRWDAVELQIGARWEAAEPLPAHAAGATVELRLYRLDDPKTVYRRVTLN
ncbi:MAG: DUF1616 domain-containing protein [Roseiflexaceae bacterium]